MAEKHWAFIWHQAITMSFLKGKAFGWNKTAVFSIPSPVSGETLRLHEAKCQSSGVDLIMPGGKKTVQALLTAYQEGRLPMDCLRQSCGRVLEQILNHFSLNP